MGGREGGRGDNAWVWATERIATRLKGEPAGYQAPRTASGQQVEEGVRGGGAAVEGSGGRGPVRAWRLNDMRDKKKTLGADIWHAGNRSIAVQADYRLKLHVGLW